MLWYCGLFFFHLEIIFKTTEFPKASQSARINFFYSTQEESHYDEDHTSVVIFVE